MKPLRQATIVLVLGFGQMVAYASSFYLLGVLGDPIAQELAVPPAFVFTLMSAAFLVSAFAAPVTGRWLDRRGGWEVLLCSSLVFGSGLALVALAHGRVGLALGMLVLGCGMAIGLYGTPFKILVGLYGDGARRPIAGVALLGGLGSTLGWPITLALEQQFGWRGACLGWALLHLGVCLPLAAWLRLPAAAGTARVPAQVAPAPVVWDRRMVQLAVLFAGAWFVSTCIGAHLPRLFGALGLSPAAAVGAASLVGVAAVTARLLEFTVLRRLSPLLTARIATLLHPLGATAVLLAGARAAPALALCQGAGNGMLTVAAGVLPLAVFGPGNYGYRSSLITMPAKFLQAAGPALFAVILGHSAALALVFSSSICLMMFLMTFGLAVRGPFAPGGPREN